jgi:predicted Zn-dependent peptidase
MYEDMPIRKVEDIFEELLYPGNNLGRDIVGNKKTIASFTRKNFLDYMSRFYMANDTIVCAAGKIDEKKVISLVGKYFSAMKKGRKEKIIPVREKQKTPQIKLKFKKTDQTHLVVGVRAYHQNHKDRYALALLSVILGGSMSSRLFMEVREKRGLAYYVRSGAEGYEDVGYLAAKAGVEHKNLKLALETILGEFRKITQGKVEEKELQKAKDLIKGKTVMGLEASDEVAAFFLEQEQAQKKMLTMEEQFAFIDKVTSEDVLRVAKDIFKNEKLNLTVIGPHKNGRELERVLSF